VPLKERGSHIQIPGLYLIKRGSRGEISAGKKERKPCPGSGCQRQAKKQGKVFIFYLLHTIRRYLRGEKMRFEGPGEKNSDRSTNLNRTRPKGGTTGG